MADAGPWAAWLLAGFALLAAEPLAPGVHLAWAGFAAVATGLAVLVHPTSFTGSALLFLGALAVSVAAGLRLRRPPTATAVNAPGGASSAALERRSAAAGRGCGCASATAPGPPVPATRTPRSRTARRCG